MGGKDDGLPGGTGVNHSISVSLPLVPSGAEEEGKGKEKSRERDQKKGARAEKVSSSALAT